MDFDLNGKAALDGFVPPLLVWKGEKKLVTKLQRHPLIYPIFLAGMSLFISTAIYQGS